ncbi:MAG TPA: hypothetical protein VMA34_17455 [Terracidiphilus sp.]|nr:hypothetical protein [Terracidiphilus sp.]
MRASARIALAASLAPALALAGCSLFPTTRHLPVPKAPELVQSETPDQLVALVDQRWNDLHSLTATVDIQATALKVIDSEATTYPKVRAQIVIGKPDSLRVYGTFFGVEAFDMASDGEDFTLKIPSKGVAYEGSDAAKGTSKNTWENLRPPFFFNAMVVRGVDPGNHYFVTTNTATMEDVKKKHLISVPEYILNVNRVSPDSPQETAVRVITFHRDDMLPYEQEIYDKDGNPETHVTYGTYASFNGVQYPSAITIRNPEAGIELVLTVEAVHENVPVKEDQFVVGVPKGIKIVHLP